MNLVGARG